MTGARKMGLAARGALALLATATTSLGHAAVFDFGANGAGLDPSGDSYSLTVDGFTVVVTAFRNILDTASTGDPVDVTWSSGDGLGAAGYGRDGINLCECGGVVDPGEGLLLDFGQVVTLTQATFAVWAGGDDAEFAFGDPSAANNGLQDITSVGTVTAAGGTATWTTGGLTGRQFFFAARDDAPADGDVFWLRSVTAVPEPSTWATMLFGFGAVGYSLRRGRRARARLTQLA